MISTRRDSCGDLVQVVPGPTQEEHSRDLPFGWGML
jgi:hypothetical protein